MKKLDDAIAKVVTASEALEVDKLSYVPLWHAFYVAVLGLLAAITEWRKGPRVCVAILATDPDDRVLLVRTARGWELPGGKVQNEPWEDAAHREAREETGLEVVLSTLGPQVLNGEPVNGASYRSVVLVARARAEGQPVAGNDALEARWFTRAELPWGELSELVSAAALRAWAQAPSALPADYVKSLREAFDSSSDEWDRLATNRALPAEPVRYAVTPAGGSWSAAIARALGTPETPPDGYAARRAQGETGHGMVLPGPCAGCQKVARHPGEGYECMAHPSSKQLARKALADLPFTADDTEAHNASVRQSGRCALPACKFCKGRP